MQGASSTSRSHSLCWSGRASRGGLGLAQFEQDPVLMVSADHTPKES